MCSASAATSIIDFAGTTAGMAIASDGFRQERRANEDINDFNQRIAREASRDALQRGAQQETATRLQAGQLRGEQRTGFAASGVDVGSGSALDVLATSAGMTELDVQTIRNNAAREAYGFEVAGAEMELQKRLKNQKVDQQEVQTLLGGASKLFSSMGGMFGGGAGGIGG